MLLHKRIGLQNAEVLDVTYDDGVTKEGCGRTGRLPHRMTLGECAQLVKKCYQVPNVRVYGELDSPVRDAAIMPGSGGSFLQNALQADADVMITGDIDHHEAIDAMAQGISIIDAGHYGIKEEVVHPIYGRTSANRIYLEFSFTQHLLGNRSLCADCSNIGR